MRTSIPCGGQGVSVPRELKRYDVATIIGRRFLKWGIKEIGIEKTGIEKTGIEKTGIEKTGIEE